MEPALRARRDAGRKLLIPYVMAGMTDDWVEVLQAIAAAGADAIEGGLPFSDPMMDGPVIQAAGIAALGRHPSIQGLLDRLSTADLDIPVAVMTYYNLVFRFGHRRFAAALTAAGVSGAIVPDLPLEELGPWADAADEAGVETVLLVAPSTPDDRISAIAERSRGFVYGVGRMGVTGEQAELATSAREVAGRIRAATDMPACIGIGVSTPDQAKAVCEVADGVIVGSALVRRLLEGQGPEGAADFVGALRQAIDAG
jgi:tryptophan synthase alpha chain